MPTPTSSKDTVLAIVMPLFKHSVLVVDALESVLSQRCQYPFAVIVVNDGCPFHESDLQIRSIQAVHPGILYSVVQRNRGLSAARNTGIRYALEKFPALQAVYFMDADNTLLPGAMDRAYTRLLGDPKPDDPKPDDPKPDEPKLDEPKLDEQRIDWVYPNIDMFGIRRHFDYEGPYSVMRHTQYNICEAGSLVHRRMLDAGLRFDEKMKQGYEDWDFWLTAAELGFRGALDPYFGFRYRNRGESMLSSSHRDDAEIQAYMRKKHPGLLGRRNLLRLEAIEAPRYAILFTDTNQVLLSTGSSDPAEAVSQEEFDRLFWLNMTIPSQQYIPPFFVLMTRTAYDRLSRLGLILWVLHDCELSLKEVNVACLVIDAMHGETFEIRPGGKSSESDIVALGRDLVHAILRSADTAWVEQVVTPDPAMKVVTKTLRVPRRSGLPALARGSAVFTFLVKVRAWRASPYRFASEKPWVWREFSVPPPHSLYFNVRAAFDGEVPYPAAPEHTKNIGFILPIASFGGVERVAYNIAEQFTRAGWRAHIFVTGQTRIDLPAEFSEQVASIHFLNDVDFHGWDPNNQYQGTALPSSRNFPGARNRVVATLAWLDVVVNCHSGDFHVAAADLRRLGVKTVSHLHLLDMSPLGRSVGHPLVTLAYEHAYDLVLCTSEQLRLWLHGAGIPNEKLLHVPNAPGHFVDAAVRNRLLARRRSQTGNRLNVLYIGRLDRQKGMDRLAVTIKQTRELELPVQWRIVGSAVTGDCRVPAVLQEMLEPAVFGSQDLTALLGWADVLVLLSDYEGVPLSVLEAQRLGVVVIATDVGALSEIISTGKNGFLVDRDAAVEQTLSLLRLLVEVPALRSKIAANASNVIGWPGAAAELIERVSGLVGEAGQVAPTEGLSSPLRLEYDGKSLG